MSKREIIRRLRLGDLQKFLRFRYGHEMPDDDAGREDLHELLLPISLGANGDWSKMKNCIEVWAPWMDSGESMQLIDRVNRTPFRLRQPTARQLGDRLGVTKQDRECLRLKTIKPLDMTDEQLKEWRKAKDRARNQRRRIAQGCKPHETSWARQKPWEAKGISRRTWFRARAKERGTNSSAIKLTSAADETVPLRKLSVRKARRHPRKHQTERRKIARAKLLASP